MHLPLLLLALSSAVLAYPSRHFNVRRQVSSLRSDYDFVIVGGGTAGLTVADRLTEHFPNKTVLVIEYGTIEEAPGVFEPPTGPHRATLFNLSSIPAPSLNNRIVRTGVGQTVGGSSAVNAQFYDRGSGLDYNEWADLNNQSHNGITWDWAGIKPFFKKSVTLIEPTADEIDKFGYSWDNDAYGGTTPIMVSFPPFQWPTSLVLRKAWQELGAKAQKECAGGSKTGLCWVPTAQFPETAERSHAGLGHYADVHATRPNYDLLTRHKVVRLFYADGRPEKGVPTVEVRSLVNGTVFNVTAGCEVVLSAGSIHTPQILQRSGIASAKFLADAGIEVVTDLPGVGYNFQDHAGPAFFFNLSNDLVPNKDMLTTNQTYLQQSETEYAQRPAQGPYTLGMANSAAFLPLQFITPENYTQIAAAVHQQATNTTLTTLQSLVATGADTPAEVLAGYRQQLQLIHRALLSAEHPIVEAVHTSDTYGPNQALLTKPLSRGSVMLNLTDHDAEPVITYPGSSNPLDLTLMSTFVGLFRRLYETESLRPLGVVDVSPGPNVTTAGEIREWLRDTMLASGLHPCCTAPMMPKDKGGVVGTDLKVHGVSGLRVIDLSIAPLVPAAHTCTTAFAIGEKGAHIMIEAHS